MKSDYYLYGKKRKLKKELNPTIKGNNNMFYIFLLSKKVRLNDILLFFIKFCILYLYK